MQADLSELYTAYLVNIPAALNNLNLKMHFIVTQMLSKLN